jgi:multisubunit Na+/H+ antiporter MnhG subunit
MFEKFFRKMFYYVAGTIFIITGVLCIAYYLMNDISVWSILIGVFGFMLIEPAFTHYAKRIQEYLENE